MNTVVCQNIASLLFVCLSLSLVVPTGAQDIQIAINASDANVYSPLVTIGDVAQVKGPNRKVVDAIKGLDLEMLTDVGDYAKINRKQIQMRIRVSDISARNLAFRGASSTTVTRQSDFVPETAVKNSIVQAIAEQFDVAPTDIRVGMDSNVSKSDLVDLANAVQQAVIVLPDQLPIGNTKVKFIYQTDDAIDQSQELKCEITILTEMLIARQNIPRGKKLTSTDVKLIKRPLNSRTIVPATLANSIGKLTSRNIPARGIVKVSDVSTTGGGFVVKRNDVVSAIYKFNGITIRMSNAQVLKPGRVGDRVQIFVPETSKTFVASVVDETTVKVRY